MTFSVSNGGSGIQTIGIQEVNFLQFAVLVIFLYFGINWIVNSYIDSGKCTKKKAERLASQFSFWGAVIAIYAISATHGMKYDGLPTVLSIYNPMLGVVVMFVGHQFDMAVKNKQVK